MTALTEIIPPSPAGGEDAPANLHNITPSRRHDGWTGERQRAFLEALSQGSSIVHACRQVGLSEQSAYGFRRSARGASFAIGWQAAQMLARETLADTLMDRALHGTDHIHFARDGSETHYTRHDNHFALKMLNRLDRMANKAGNDTTHAAARLVAGDFEQYLDMIARDGGPARAGLFLGARLGAEGAPAGEDDLAPVRALARADKWLRTHTDLAEPLATADLDPAQRSAWTAEQWLRAEAAGLLQLAPPAPEPEPEVEPPETAKLRQDSDAIFDDPPVWWDNKSGEWRTRFPPPADFNGDERGEYGDCDYSRALSPSEQALIDADIRAEIEAQRAEETIERDAWFASIGAPPAPGDAPEPPRATGAPSPSPAPSPPA